MMSFVNCKLTTTLESFSLIENGAVPAYLENLVSLPTSASNSQASFTWKVFSVGRSDQMTITCDMKVLHTDECALGTHNCDNNAACSDTDSGFTCSCNNGFNGDGFHCVELTCEDPWSKYTYGTADQCWSLLSKSAASQAHQQCLDIGGSLVLPSSDQESTDLISIMSNFGLVQGDYVHLRSNDVAIEDQWIDMASGEVIGYTNWLAGYLFC